MDENGRLKLASGVAELESELFGELHIELDGSALVISANAILDQNVDLRRVERSIALLDGVFQTQSLENGAKLRLGVLPLVALTDRLAVNRSKQPNVAGLRGENEGEIEAQLAVERFDGREQRADFLADLIPAAEDVSIVLSGSSLARLLGETCSDA